MTSSARALRWTPGLLGATALLLCLGLGVGLAAEDIDTLIRKKIEHVEALSADYKFFDRIVQDPDIWLAPGTQFPVPVPKQWFIDALSADYRRTFVDGKKPWEEYSHQELPTVIMRHHEFTKAMKAEIRTLMQTIEHQLNDLRAEIAALEKKRSLPPPPAGAQASARARIGSSTEEIDTTDWAVIKLSEFGFHGEFKQSGEGQWEGKWGGGCEDTTFSRQRSASTTIEGVGRFDIILKRKDGSCPFSPGLVAEYQLRVTPSEGTVGLAGNRKILDPGSNKSLAGLLNNTTDVTGSVTLQK